jgi:hypothetical protein
MCTRHSQVAPCPLSLPLSTHPRALTSLRPSAQASLAEAHELVTRPEMRLALNRASEWLASVGRERNPLKAICVVLLFAFCVWLLRPARGAVLTAAPIFLKRRRRL